jgi:O-antigen/teichoic acid export membrane protein
MSTPTEILAAPFPRTWRSSFARLRLHSSHARLFSGSMVMLVGSTLVSLVNFGYNVAVARMLGPGNFSQAAAAVTLLMLVSSITLAFQLTCAKFVAKNETPATKAYLYRTLRKKAWYVGTMLGGAVIVLSTLISDYLRMSTPLILIMAIGIAFYIPLGARRGAMMGTTQFVKLSTNFVLEALVKLITAVVLVKLGYGVMGAVIAIAASVVVAYSYPWVGGGLDVEGEPGTPASITEGMQSIVFFVGQVIINNIDILMVKHFFASSDAGLYAAVALVGRVLYFASWSVVSAMFPISASAKPQDQNSSVLIIPLLIVVGIAFFFTVFLGLFPDFVLRMLFGQGFHGKGIEAMLSLYASTTGAYALAVVLTAYEISRRIANVAWLQLAFSVLVVIGIALFHETLREVIVVQQVLMVLLLISVSLPFFRRHRHRGELEAL